jgi:hypothetical protein
MSRRTSRAAVALALIAISAGAMYAWRGVLGLALLGWDSYPLILAGRIQNASEFAATFSEELMDGAYPLGHFWRPVVHLSFGVDYALGGLEPFRYHATSLVLLALCAGALFLLTRKLLGGGALLAPLVAAVLYALHPVQLEILTVPARRAESFAVLFTLLALLAQPFPGELKRRAWGAGLCCALALASKETGAMAVGMVLALAIASSAASDWRARAFDGLRTAFPSLLLFVLAFVARTLALSGLGGSAESSLTANLASAPGVLRGYLHALVSPGGFTPEGSPIFSDALLVLLVALIVRIASSSAGLPRPGSVPHALTPSRCGLFLVLSALLVALITSVSGLERGWYALPFLPLLALAIALLLHLGLQAVTRGPKLAGGCAFLLVLRLVAVPLFAAPIDESLQPQRLASEDEQRFLERFTAAVEAAAPGSTITVAGLPTERRADPRDPKSPNLLMLAPYSVAAYAKLRFPVRAVRIELVSRNSGRPAQPEEVVVLLAP